MSERHRPDGYNESLLETSPSAIAIVDMDDVVTSWNPAAERLFGYSRDEAMGRKIDSLVASRPDVYSEAVEVSSRARAGEDVHVVTRRTRKDGTLVDVDVVGCAIFVDGQAGRVLRDLHRHRRAAAAEALLRGALRFEPDRDRCPRHERNRYRVESRRRAPLRLHARRGGSPRHRRHGRRASRSSCRGQGAHRDRGRGPGARSSPDTADAQGRVARRRGRRLGTRLRRRGAGRVFRDLQRRQRATGADARVG